MFIQSAALTQIPDWLKQDVLLKTLLQTTREGVALVDQSGQLQCVNERLYEWLQLWAQQEQHLSAFIPPNLWQRLRNFFNSTQPSFQSHLELHPASGPEIPAQLRAQRLPATDSPCWLLLFSDLRREHQLESTLSGSHDQQFNLLHSLPVPAAIVRMSDSLILQGNEEFSNWYGLPLNSLTLQPLHDFFIRPSDWLFLVEESRRKAGLSIHELQVRNPDGSAVWSQTFAQQITFDGHQALMLVFYDITQYKQVEKSMAWSKRLIQNMMTAQSQFVAKSDPDTIFLHVLDHVLSMTFSEFGFIVSCPEHTEQLQVLAINHTHWSLDTVETFARSAQREFEHLYQARHTLCAPLFSGSLSFCEQADELYYPWMKRFMGIPLYSSGECFGMLGLANSPYPYNELLEMELHPLLVTIGHLIAAWHNDQQRREAEAQLARRNHQLNVLHSDVRQLIDNASVPVFAIDLHGIIREWNTAMVQLSELQSEDMLNGVLLEQMLTAHTQTNLELILDKVRQGRSIENLELSLKRANGQSLRLLTSLTPRRDENGDLIGAWGMGQNITSLADYQEWLQLEIKKKTHALQTALFEQRQMTVHLSQMLEKEEALFALRDRFAAVASHEFRGPLAAIQIAAENLCNPDVQLNPEQVERKVQRIKKRADQLHYLVHDILLLTQLDAGHLSFHPEPCQLQDFCEQVIEEVQIATQSSHRIHASYPSLHIWMDQRLMRLIVSNLLHNAIKFSLDHFEIWLRVYPEQEWLCFEIEDRGLGVTETEAEEIFKPFFRSPRVVHQTSGMGLGLELVRRCVDLHQGEINMQPQEQGTLFLVKVPFRE